jgi:hypothetical protein
VRLVAPTECLSSSNRRGAPVNTDVRAPAGIVLVAGLEIDSCCGASR